MYKYVKISNYKRSDGTYKLGDIFKRYLRWYNEEGIVEVSGMGIKNIPSLPKVKELRCEDNSINRIVGDFSNLEYLNCSLNNITELGIMPELKVLEIDNNPIKEIGNLNNLIDLTAKNMDGLGKIHNINSNIYMDIGNKKNVNKRITLENITNASQIKINTYNVGDITNIIPEMKNVITETFKIYTLRE
jgi:hypothetical protein